MFPYALTRVLRSGQGELGPAEPLLPATELEHVRDSVNPALAVALRMSAVLVEARQRGLISDYMQLQLDQNIQLLIDYQGGCERIVRTPMPFSYMLHLRRTLILFLFTLPFALVDVFGWLSVPVVFLIAHTLLGVEEIGVEIEDPFGFEDNDLPLEEIPDSIARTLDEVVPWSGQPIPSPALPAPGLPLFPPAAGTEVLSP